MRLQISEDIMLTTEPKNYVLSEKKVVSEEDFLKGEKFMNRMGRTSSKKVGDIAWVKVAFFSKIDHVASWLIERKMKTSQVTVKDLKELTSQMDVWVEKISAAIKTQGFTESIDSYGLKEEEISDCPCCGAGMGREREGGVCEECACIAYAHTIEDEEAKERQ